MKTRAQGWELLNQYCSSQSLLKHAQAVEASMRWYAEHFGESAEMIELYGLTGLLHDFDYEKYPEPVAPNGHPFMGNKILTELDFPEELRTAIMGHALYSGVPRESRMAKTLFAVDELSGLVMASVLVRPDKSIAQLEAKSVLKKMKDKAFARGCNRDDITLGAAELGIDMPTHVNNVIAAMRVAAAELNIA